MVTTTIRQLLQNHKTILERVQQTGEPTLVVNQNEPQVAIMALTDYEELRRLRRRKALEDIEKLAEQMSKEHTDNPLPSDLGEEHDKYFLESWEEEHHQQ